METHNYYLFSVCDPMEFCYRVDEITRENWKAYLGLQADEWFWFEADRVAKAAQAKGDALMVSYVRNLEKYLDCASSVSEEQWDYPSKQELAKRRQTLTDIRLYAQGKLSSRLRSQHALLFMRCNMLLGRHQENTQFWKQTASQYIETVYKDMMLNIYAGALLRTGHTDEACAIYAQQGDWRSLMTQYYKRRSYEAIRAEYERDPNSPVLPFLVQDFVNNTQEAADAAVDEYSVGGKLFIRDISRQEAMQMCQFASEVVRSGRSKQPVLWQSARAWIEFLMGQHTKAAIDIQQALSLAGTPRQKMTARVISFYIRTATTPPTTDIDAYVAQEMKWLEGCEPIGSALGGLPTESSDSYLAHAMDRIVHQVLMPRYTAARRTETTLAILAATHAPIYESIIDTVGIDAMQRFMAYASGNAHSSSPLDTYLQPHVRLNAAALCDLLATKYMRLCKWQEAAKWLVKVPASFYDERGYAPYAALRRTNVEPWIRRQWLKESYIYGEQRPHVTTNPKLAFVREMQDMESGLSALHDKARQQRCYDLAVRYAQANYAGDCWWLMRDAKSESDTVRVNETDLRLRAVGYLRQVVKGPDMDLKERALFALAYQDLNSDLWYESDWNSDAQDWVRTPLRTTKHYAAWTALTVFYHENDRIPAPYVSRCDEFKQFIKF